MRAVRGQKAALGHLRLRREQADREAETFQGLFKCCLANSVVDNVNPFAIRNIHHLLVEVCLGVHDDFICAGIVSEFRLLSSGDCCDDLRAGILCH